MRGLEVDRNGVREVDLDPADPFPDWDDYGALTFDDGHDIWFDDEGLFKPAVCVARIGDHDRVPLPAIILGAQGEHCVDATLSVEQVRSSVGERIELG